MTAERPIVLADANVLFSNDQRNILVTFSLENLLALRWSAKIESEWVTNLLAKNPAVARENIERTVHLMRRAVPDWSVEPPQVVFGHAGRTRPGDRHVAAAAIACAPSILVTWNTRDFDEIALAEHEVIVRTPDQCLCDIFDAAPATALAATQRAFGYVRKIDCKPAWSDYLDRLAHRGRPASLLQFSARLRAACEGEDSQDA